MSVKSTQLARELRNSFKLSVVLASLGLVAIAATNVVITPTINNMGSLDRSWGEHSRPRSQLFPEVQLASRKKRYVARTPLIALAHECSTGNRR